MEEVDPMGVARNNPQRSFIVDVLIILFGISSWVAINGLWVELPVLVNSLPESWQLASYIVITSQIANLGPILFSAARRIWSQKVLEVPIIHASLALVTLGSALLSVFWDYTSYLFGGTHSTALFVLTFFLACVDCTSSLLYLPFIAHFKEQYVISYLVGSGLSGPLPGLLAFAQGVGGYAECRNVSVTNTYGNETQYKIVEYHPPPRFSPNIFFALLCGQMIISWLAFILLNLLSVAKNERVSLMPIFRPSLTSAPENLQSSNENDFSSSLENTASTTSKLLNKERLSRTHYLLLLTVQGFLSTIHNGVLLSIQTYSCLPYGSIAFHLTVTLSSIANPLCCFIAMFFPLSDAYSVFGSAVFVTGWAAYILTTAILSPNPPFVGIALGAFLVILAWVLVSGSVAYTKACVASILRREGGQTALYQCGVVTQIGSAVGAITTFLLIKYTTLFNSYSPCEEK